MDTLKQRCLALLQEYMVDNFKFENSKKILNTSTNNKTLLESSAKLNQLDSIELPEFVNTKILYDKTRQMIMVRLIFII